MPASVFTVALVQTQSEYRTGSERAERVQAPHPRTRTGSHEGQDEPRESLWFNSLTLCVYALRAASLPCLSERPAGYWLMLFVEF